MDCKNPLGFSWKEVPHDLSVQLHIEEVQTSPGGGTEAPPSICGGDSSPRLESLDPLLVFHVVQMSFLTLLQGHDVGPLCHGEQVGHVLHRAVWPQGDFLAHFPRLRVIDVKQTLNNIIIMFFRKKDFNFIL